MTTGPNQTNQIVNSGRNLKKRGRLKGDCKPGLKMNLTLKIKKMEMQNLPIAQNSIKSLMQSNSMACEDEIKKSLIIAMERLDMQFLNIDYTISDIITEFDFMKLKDLILALRKGALGKYGRSYKLNTQEVCYWIREYQKENKNKLGI